MSDVISDACPDCGSTDVTDTDPMRRGRSQPPYYCYECGIRFSNPERVDTVTGERV